MEMNLSNAPVQMIAEWLSELGNKAYDADKSGDYDAYKRLYNFIFSDDVSHVIFQRFSDFDYYDPDADYSDDVCAFISSFGEYVRRTGDAQYESFEDWFNRKSSEQ